MLKRFTEVHTSDNAPEFPNLTVYFTLTYLQCTYYMLKISYFFFIVEYLL